MVEVQRVERLSQIREQIAQAGERFLNRQDGLALGASLLTLAACNVQPAVAAQGSMSAREFGPTLTDPSFATMAIAAGQCETVALSAPASLTGGYVGGYVLNNNNYEIQATNKTLPKGCHGKLAVSLFQQKQEEGIGLHPKLTWTPNGFRPDHSSTDGRHKEVVLRAARQCWSLSNGGGGDYDKKHDIKARPAETKTYTPTGGQPVSMTFTGRAAQVC